MGLDASSFGSDPILSGLLILSSIFVASFPLITFLIVLWWMDRYQREPLWLLSLTFFWGALIATVASFLGNTFLSSWIGQHTDFEPSMLDFVTGTLVAPLVEEPAKAGILLVIVASRYFNSVTDGFVYGAAAGLGFGMTENFFYFSGLHDVMSTSAESLHPDFEDLPPGMQKELMAMALNERVNGFTRWLDLASIRTFGSAMMHAVATSIVGAALAWARFKPRLPGCMLIGMGAFIAIFMHGLWNGLALAPFLQTGNARMEAVMTGLTPLLYTTFALEFIMVFCVFQLSLLNERQTIREELIAEAEEFGTLPHEHVPFLGNNLSRSLQRFAPPGVSQESYIKMSTLLAFRRAQARIAPPRVRDFYRRDLGRVRGEVQTILNTEQPRIESV